MIPFIFFIHQIFHIFLPRAFNSIFYLQPSYWSHLSGNWKLLHPLFPSLSVWLFEKSDFDFQNCSDHFQFLSAYFPSLPRKFSLQNILHSFILHPYESFVISFHQFLCNAFLTFTALATSSFHHHVSVCQHCPFDFPHVLCCFHHNIFHLRPLLIYTKVLPILLF